MMAKALKWAAVISFCLTAVFTGVYFKNAKWAISWGITFGTFCYHFTMRLLVGFTVDRILQNRADYNRNWYRLRPFEVRLYRALKVKKWKHRMPTYDPSSFDPKLHSWEQIAQAMCQAEIVHEIIILLSFLPLLAAIPFGSFWVFLITSLLAACYDLCFVILQRFNRPRIIKLLTATQRTPSDRRKTDAEMES